MGKKEESTQPMVAKNEIFTKEVRPVGLAKYTVLELLDTLRRLGLWVLDLLLSMLLSLASFIKTIGVGLVKGVMGVYRFFKRKAHQFRYNDKWGRMSFGIFGMSSYAHGQVVNGVLFSLFQVGYILAFALIGCKSILLLFNARLGVVEYVPGDLEHDAIIGDNSVLILIFGLLWIISIFVFFYIWNRSINSGYNNYRTINFVRFEKLINPTKELAAKINNEAIASYDAGIFKWQFKSLVKKDVDVHLELFEDLDDKRYVYYLLSGVGPRAYKYKRELKAKTRRVERLNNKLHRFIVSREAGDRLLVERSETERAMAIAKYQTLIDIATDEETRETALLKQQNELPRELEKIEIRLEKYRNRTLRVTSDLKNKLKKRQHLVDGLNKTYVNFVEWQSTRNNDKYGKLNRYYREVASFDNELLFYKNYNVFKEVYEKSLGGAEQANIDNKDKGVRLLEEKNAKIQATNDKFDKIYARKDEFDKQIKQLKVEYNQKIEELKAAGASEEELMSAKADLVEKTTRLANAARDLPSDKSIKGLYKEEIKESKSAYKRDKKYLKTNYTPESYAREKVIDKMLVEYKIEYKDAVYFARNLLDDKTKKFLTTEEVNNRINDLENRKSNYLEEHPDKFEGRPKKFKEQFKSLFNENFHITILALPILGIVLLSIVPLLFSIIVAFTNYGVYEGVKYLPPQKLFGWFGFENFQILFSGQGQLRSLPMVLTRTLGWTFIWAFLATFTNYILGIIVALMINKKGIKLKKLWRTVFVMTIAVPQFISLLSISTLLSQNGAIDQLWMSLFGAPLNFAQSGHAALTRTIIVLVNVWVGIPYTILSTTGILLNIPEDLYESARVDGAGTFKQFVKITMPYIVFVTGPYLITQFVGNFNNFNVIYFLTQGGPTIPGTNPALGETDILITFLYKLITDSSNPQYGVASAVGIFIFMICAFISIVMYNKTGAVKEEDQFQ